MMRSLYSGVAGLKTHQTRMDVIGNNIANVNTVGFKGSAANFADTFYQNMSPATGPNAALRTAGQNAKQIGLGSSVASITTNITENGGTSTTNRALDVAINGESFLIVSMAGETYFTKSGALNVDTAGNLMCTTNGGIVQGYMADEDGNVIKDTVRDLKIKTAETMSSEPTATTAITMQGNVDPNDKQLAPTMSADGDVVEAGGAIMTFSFYDNIGELYTVTLRLTKDEAPETPEDSPTVPYTVRVENVLDSNGDSIFVKKIVDETTGQTTYAATGAQITFGSSGTAYGVEGDVNVNTGEFKLNSALCEAITFNSATGAFAAICPDRLNQEHKGKSVNFSVVQTDAEHVGPNSTFPQYTQATDNGGIEVDFSSLTQYSKGGTCELTYKKGDADGYEAGNFAGKMNGISIDEQGYVYGNYTNGETKCLAQIAVATFANPSGLEAVGDSLFQASLNSGLFDGIGEAVNAAGGSFTVGALEMSNVDLANEFTTMITTQRGFQANSRIITTSDTMLEELVNLKR